MKSVSERFLRYVSFDTMSDENSPTCPSSAKQKLLGQALVEEMLAMGIADAHMDENGYVYGTVPGDPSLPTIGLIAHMDTAPAVPTGPVHARCIVYQGGDIVLESGAVMRPGEYPSLNRHVGQELIVTDGRTLLGADDKAGVAEILSACAYLVAHPEIPHGRIAVGITPDEEIGRGADHFDLARFAASAAYTVDGGALGELEYENFNAASCKVAFHGCCLYGEDWHLLLGRRCSHHVGQMQRGYIRRLMIAYG